MSGGQLQLTITRINHHNPNPKPLREYIRKKDTTSRHIHI